MTFSAKIWPSFDSYGHLHVKKLPKSFSPWISTSNMTQNGQKWTKIGSILVLLGPKLTKNGFVSHTFYQKVVFYAQFSSLIITGHKNYFLVKVILYKTIFVSILGLKGPK